GWQNMSVPAGLGKFGRTKCLLIVLCQRPRMAFCRTPNGEAMLADQFVAAAAARNTHTVDEVVRLTWRAHAAHPGSRGGFRQPLSTSSAVHTVSSRTNFGRGTCACRLA